MNSNQNSDPYQNPDRLAFESIGASTWKVLLRLQQAQLAGSLLAQSFFVYQTNPGPLGWFADDLWKQIHTIYGEIEEEAVSMFLLERRRHEPNGRVWSEARPVPEVSSEDAHHALMIVTEVADAILVAVCLSLFGEEPRVKILTPEVAAVHKELRVWWEEKRKAAPQVEEFTHPDWMLKKSADGMMFWVGDSNDDFIIQPTQIEQLPLIITATRHNRHGARLT